MAVDPAIVSLGRQPDGVVLVEASRFFERRGRGEDEEVVTKFYSFVDLQIIK